jgi:hypothetical protein
MLDNVAPEKPVPDHEGEIHCTDGPLLHFLMRQSAEFDEVVEIDGIVALSWQICGSGAA